MPAPECPRCGYDLSGMTDWRDSCPLMGKCSECGLDYEWRDVLRPELHMCRGLYEHARWLALGSFFRTIWWTLRPKKFWERIELHHIVVRRRLLLFLMVLILPLYIFAGATSIIGTLAFPWSTWHDYVHPWVNWIVDYWWSKDIEPSFRYWRFYGIVCSLITLTFPVLLVLLWATRSQIKVRLRHIARAAVYSMSWILVPLVLRAVFMFFDMQRRASRGRTRSSLASFLDSTTDALDWVLAFLIGGWLFWWWYCAIRFGMKFPEPNKHFAILSVTVLLLVLVIVLGSPDFWWHPPWR